jgi:hypothetical protein
MCIHFNIKPHYVRIGIDSHWLQAGGSGPRALRLEALRLRLRLRL